MSVAVLERTARYSKDKITCSCGTSFSVLLETRLSDDVFESHYDTEMSDEEKYVCPNCSTQYNLEISVEKTVETTYVHLETLGQFISNDLDESISISALKGKWIGDRIIMKDAFEEEEIIFPDGIFHTDGKEYTVKDGIVVNYWSLADENQLGLFEEVA